MAQKISRLDFVSEDAIHRIAKEECDKHLSGTASLKRPAAYLLIGQPGSGKTRIATLVKVMAISNAIFINNDENRYLHPFYSELSKLHKEKVNDIVSPFASSVTEEMIETLSDNKRSLIIEGTGHHINVQMETAYKLYEKGYVVNVAVMAEKPVISRFSTVLRGVKMCRAGLIPRYVSLSLQDDIISVLPENLNILSSRPYISECNIWSRTLTDIYADKKQLPSKFLKAFWKENLTLEEIEYIKSGISEIEESQVILPKEQQEYFEKIKNEFAKGEIRAKTLENKLSFAKEREDMQSKGNTKEKNSHIIKNWYKLH